MSCGTVLRKALNNKKGAQALDEPFAHTHNKKHILIVAFKGAKNNGKYY